MKDNSLSPKQYQTLALTIELEKSNAFRISEWADRFRTFNPKVSLGLDALTKELKSGHLDSENLYRRKFGHGHTLTQEQNRCHVATYLDAPEINNHFFVLNNDVAKEMLQAMIVVGNKITTFYRQVVKNTKNKPLLANYKKLLKSELMRMHSIRMLQA